MKHGHARWYGRAVSLAVCPGSENVRVAYRHQLLKVSQEQLRMATITERVADDVIHQELSSSDSPGKPEKQEKQHVRNHDRSGKSDGEERLHKVQEDCHLKKS